jgi:hypothetical protein
LPVCIPNYAQERPKAELRSGSSRWTIKPIAGIMAIPREPARQGGSPCDRGAPEQMSAMIGSANREATVFSVIVGIFFLGECITLVAPRMVPDHFAI